MLDHRVQLIGNLVVHEVSQADDRAKTVFGAASLIPCSSFVGEDDGTIRRRISQAACAARPDLTGVLAHRS